MKEFSLESKAIWETQPVNNPPIYICIDLETTGLHASEHGICQIGAVALAPRNRLQLNLDVNPLPCKISSQALTVNGFTLDRIKAGRTLDDALSTLADFVLSVSHPVLVFHNAPFDTDFLKAGFQRLSPVALNTIRAAYHARGFVPDGLDFADEMPGMRRVLDTVSMGFALLPHLTTLPSLATLVAELDIDASSWKAHDALGDAEILATVFEVLMDQRKCNNTLDKQYNELSFSAGYETATCHFLDILEKPVDK